MTDTYTVKITSQAEEQIQEIAHYIAHELNAPDAALHLLDELEEAFSTLTHLPQRVALVSQEPWRTKGIHRLSVKNFFMYFWIDEDKLVVQITAIVYSKRDQFYQLSQMDME